MAILQDISVNGQGETVEQEMFRLRREIEDLKRARAIEQLSGNGMKIGEKGGLSVYGLGRFPVTLYKGQWLRLLDMADKIRAFINANDHLLTSKD